MENGCLESCRLMERRVWGAWDRRESIPMTTEIGYCRTRFETYLGYVGKEGTMALPEVGSTPPAFTLPNQDGEGVSLADYAGRNVLIWFFPRAYGGG